MRTACCEGACERKSDADGNIFPSTRCSYGNVEVGLNTDLSAGRQKNNVGRIKRRKKNYSGSKLIKSSLFTYILRGEGLWKKILLKDGFTLIYIHSPEAKPLLVEMNKTKG